ncbi:MarR family transcriptional regulator [Nocardia wallacei]|uniref:MarR family transcriptional regulator n=1 Tax=Nocardia wallacei TaxID=480035 RepID=UPI002457AFBF|nr:helix-turn-helix domain-containing protein [Nocardia wallacei]
MTRPPFLTDMQRVAAAELRVLDLLSRVEWLTTAQLAAEAELDERLVHRAAIRLHVQRMVDKTPGPRDGRRWQITPLGDKTLLDVQRSSSKGSQAL